MSERIPAVLAKVVSNQKKLTLSENEIANFVIENPDFVTKNTITALAEKVGVSETSINRFCKKIGFKGFNDFKIALVQDVFYRKMKSKSINHDQVSFVESIAFDYNDLLMNTSSLITDDQLAAIAAALISSKKIMIYGILSSWLVGMELKQKLNMMGFTAAAYNDRHNMKLSASLAGKDDLIIAISRSGTVKEIIEALTIASQNNAKIVIITSFDSTKITALADIKIITSDILSVKNSTYISHHIPFLFAIDLIIGNLLTNHKAYLEKKLNAEALLEGEQFWNNYYL
ncbi:MULTISPECIES: MurR/RpiR family transcriptional regulator [Bacillus]|uniref:RpiR family transcriptional regulator n=2 Tax=Bacillus TaxID=1386 RepID=A0A0M4FRI6_9BACI|nr:MULTISPECIES: MurR/RpiR family transcriptional regulator [Bacillus]ALC80368.1 RpiR family transcriptional regulator [Bacillus gobiensis]MBP1083785.1 DNA-binding MurR/RpiR family transcriptional regulator [Bacillus capparidis]MED1098270.1 MurR/RpiR family transcriptional regulator [Bacillus capparidis]